MTKHIYTETKGDEKLFVYDKIIIWNDFKHAQPPGPSPPADKFE